MTIQPEDTVINVIPLGGWLVSATSVTVYEDTARTASATWTEGTSGDYFMGPYNVMGQPYYFLKVNEDTSKSLYAGQKTLAVAGTWGWQDTGDTVTTTSGTWTDSATSLDVTSAADISEGSTIKVGTEQLYVTSISSNTLTVQRGVHGTTAASATGGTDVLKITLNPLVTQTCLDLAHIVYRDRDLGFNDRDENPQKWTPGQHCITWILSPPTRRVQGCCSDVHIHVIPIPHYRSTVQWSRNQKAVCQGDVIWVQTDWCQWGQVSPGTTHPGSWS